MVHRGGLPSVPAGSIPCHVRTLTPSDRPNVCSRQRIAVPACPGVGNVNACPGCAPFNNIPRWKIGATALSLPCTPNLGFRSITEL